MFDHVSLKVRDFEKSTAFYRAALAPLGYEAQHLDEAGKSVGFGPKGDVGLWLAEGNPPSRAVHVAFASPSRAAVAAFFEAAVAAGGEDNGRPDLRPDYAHDDYAAFVLDPDGNNVEAVVHEAKLATKRVYYMGSYDIDAPELYRQYGPRVVALLPKYGGELLASDTSAYVAEGRAAAMNAIIRFPSKEAALGLYGDPEYQEAKRIRQRSTSNVSMVLAEETTPPRR
ncbi:MAG TPA: DUF1330 domain-containing protein [Minicystis sp.]|nr:DUF1330 domain-containing protein [Minicystis sp.]